MSTLPIDRELLEKRMAIPSLLAELSHLDAQRSVELLQVWGEKRMAITPLYELLVNEIRSCRSGVAN